MTTEELGLESAKHSEQLKSLSDKVEKLDEKMNVIEGITISVEKLAMSVEQIAKNQAEDRAQQKIINQKQEAISQRLIDIESNPLKDKASTYDKVKDKILMAIVGALVGYFLKTFGL